jgi:penicillin-binding protein 2
LSSSSLRPPAPRRTVRIGSRPLVEPISVADAGFFRSGGFYLRVSVLGVVVFAAFALLGLRLWSLQLVQGPRYASEASREVFRYVRLPAPRAAIVDRKGRVLAGTEGRLSVTADANTLGSLDDQGRWHPSEEGLASLRRLARLSKTPVGRLVSRIRREQLRTPRAPAVVLPRARRALTVFLNEQPWRFPGLHVTPYPERSYPQGRIGSEFLGLLGEVSPQQLKQRRHRRHRMGEVIGQSGVEARYDKHLNLGLARARVAVDARGHAIGPLTVVDQPRPSHLLKLTIDTRIQRAAERAVEYGIGLARKDGSAYAGAGAAVVMDARTGALRALVSVPNYNQVRAARDRKYLTHVLARDDYVNRAIAGTYPAGSTFKPIVAQAALSAGLIGPWSTLPCTSSFVLGTAVFRNVAAMNASLNLRDALKVSCDTWFYRLGYAFYLRDSLEIQRWSRRLGLGAPTGVDVTGEEGGIVPTPQWLRRERKQVWYPGQSVILSIGQGFLTVTPLQMAVAYAALANGGRVVRPHVAHGLYDEATGRPVKKFRRPARRVKLIAPELIGAGLYAAANLPGGTSASVFGDFPVKVAGKTGTAEVPPRPDHSWYASWAPAGNPRYVVVVLIEHGGFGAVSAAPAARRIYEALFRIKATDARPS